MYAVQIPDGPLKGLSNKRNFTILNFDNFKRLLINTQMMKTKQAKRDKKDKCLFQFPLSTVRGSVQITNI